MEEKTQKVNANGKKVADRIGEDGTVIGEVYELELPSSVIIRHHTGYPADNNETEVPNIH